MKPDWSLDTLLSSLHKDIHQKLSIARESFGHPGTKGDASEGIWLDLLQKYLPQRYQAMKGHVVDSQGNFSQQIDIVIFDRQYTPFIFNFESLAIIPAESVYAVFEAKQDISAHQINYAKVKAASVRDLHRTSLPIPYAAGVYPAKPLINIIAGILCLESSWNPPMGKPMLNALNEQVLNGDLDIGCVAAHGAFVFSKSTNDYVISNHAKHATAFLFELISMLQASGTVPMIDIKSYGSWLTK